MIDLIQKIANRLGDAAYNNEAAIRLGIIEPVLAKLGWDITDPLLVLPEYSSQGRRVDYALCAFPRRPNIFIEAKAIGKVEAADRQLFEYAFHEGVPFAILTDGRTWSFYLPAAQGSYEDRRLHKLDLLERAPQECVEIFRRYLAFDRQKNNAAFTDAQQDYANRANERVAADTLEKAWSEIISEPDPILIDLLIERTEALCGIRPPIDSTREFFVKYKGAVRIGTSTPSPVSLTIQPQSISTTHVSPTSTPPVPIRKRGAFGSFNGTPIEGKQIEVFVELLSKLAHTYPNKIELMAEAVKTRTRSHIARSKVEIYPNRPDLAENAREFYPGWLVGANISSTEKAKILHSACRACGVAFGSALQFEP